MAQGKKTSSEKISEVISKKIENPDKSLRDLEKETGVNYKVVGDIINDELPELVTSSNKARNLLDVNLSIINEGKRIIEQEIIKLGKGEGNVKINSLNDIKTLSSTLEDAFKQNQLLQTKPTEIVGINTYKNLSTEELLALKSKQDDGQE